MFALCGSDQPSTQATQTNSIFSVLQLKTFSHFSQKPQNIMASIVICLKVLIQNMTLKKSKHFLSPAILRFLKNKMSETASFAIILKRCECHV